MSKIPTQYFAVCGIPSSAAELCRHPCTGCLFFPPNLHRPTSTSVTRAARKHNVPHMFCARPTCTYATAHYGSHGRVSTDIVQAKLAATIAKDETATAKAAEQGNTEDPVITSSGRELRRDEFKLPCNSNRKVPTEKTNDQKINQRLATITAVKSMSTTRICCFRTCPPRGAI